RARFAGTAGHGVFRQIRYQSNNPTWHAAGLKDEIIPAMTTCEGRVFAATQSSGLMVASEDGDNWMKVEGGLPADIQILKLAVDGQTIYAGTKSGLWRSMDKGVHWSKIPLPTSKAVSAVFLDGTNFFVGTRGDGVLVSTDKGATWR